MMYPGLFQRGNIGKMELKNRFIMAPMGNNFALEDGALSELQIAHYEKRARGGVGLIITESSPIDALGIHGKNRIQIHREEAVRELKILTEIIHQYDTKIALQLTHAGRKCNPDLIGEYPLAPSSMYLPNKNYIPRSLSVEEIQEIIEKFAEGAKKAQEANFDGIVLLAASGHLIHQFLSDKSNRRSDCYGGTLENRTRFLLEIIDRIHEVTLGELPIGVKLLGKEPDYEGSGTDVSFEDYLEISKKLVEHGVDSIHISPNMSYVPDVDLQELNALAKRMKEEVHVKISIAGGIDSPDLAEKILQDGNVDFVELGRALLSDPDFCTKALEARSQDIRPCLNCNYCRHKTKQKNPIQCTVNPFLGTLKDSKNHESPVDSSQPIIIIGGGPAGMQAAIHLSEKGYHGKIFEKSAKLGGLLLSAAIPPEKQRIKRYMDYLIHQMQKTSFEVVLNQCIDSDSLDLIKKEWPAAVILATGGKPSIPDYVNFDSGDIFLATDVILDNTLIKGNRIVILGAGQVACETADLLSEINPKHRITMMCSSKVIAKNVIEEQRKPLLKSIVEKNVRLMVNATPLSIKQGTLIYSHNDIKKEIAYDSIILAKGWKSDQDLYHELQTCTDHLYLIGDAVSPRSILEAVEEAVNLFV